MATGLNRATRRAIERHKLPPRRVKSDDYTVDVGGETYTPRAGEWVEFSGAVNVKLLLASTALMELDSANNAENMQHFRAALEDVVAGLAPLIRSWNWTNDAGERLPSPPSEDNLRDLTLEEVIYLMGAAGRGARGNKDTDRKNGSSP